MNILAKPEREAVPEARDQKRKLEPGVCPTCLRSGPERMYTVTPASLSCPPEGSLVNCVQVVGQGCGWRMVFTARGPPSSALFSVNVALTSCKKKVEMQACTERAVTQTPASDERPPRASVNYIHTLILDT